MTAAAATVEPLFTWRPNPGPQTEFLASSAYEGLYGGAAGPGKTEALLVAPLRWVHHPQFRAIIFRRTFPELEKSVIDRSRRLYPGVAPGAMYNGQEKTWRFPSGARIYFGHLEHEHSVLDHQSSEYQFIGFDELTHFTEKQYVYMLTRARSSAGLPIRVRSGSNPGGPGHEWVLRRWGPWLDRAHQSPVEPGEVLWFLNTAEGEQRVPFGTPEAFSRTFVPGRLADNPHITKNDPGYRQRLMGQDAVTRAQLLDGDWMARPAAGAYFKRSWFRFIDVAPVRVAARIRRWDLAATEGGGDWTVGIRYARTIEGQFIVEDMVRLRGSPHRVKSAVESTAALDPAGTIVGMSQDPGQAGKSQAEDYVKALARYEVRVFRETGDKVVRAQPVSAQTEAGNVLIVRGAWNETAVQELEAFPDGTHDDIVDALSGAHNALISIASGRPDAITSDGAPIWTRESGFIA